MAIRRFYAFYEGVDGNSSVEYFTRLNSCMEAINKHRSTGYQAGRITQRRYERELKHGAYNTNQEDAD